MSSVPLYRLDGAANASHQVTAPGGYEWWHFDAHDRDSDRHVSIELFAGSPFDARYLRRYARYRRWPTRFRPPVPQEFVRSSVKLFRAGRVEERFTTRHEPGRLFAEAQTLHVRAGNDELKASEDARIVSVTMRGKGRVSGQDVAIDLRFAPVGVHRAGERELLRQSVECGAHRWILANPICRVDGSIHLSGRAPFHGLGYHDHFYGTCPIAAGVRRWFRGRVLDDEGEGCVAFQTFEPQNWRSQPESHVVEVNGENIASESQLDDSQLRCDWSRRTRALLAYPESVEIGETLRLSGPQVIASSMLGLTLTYRSVHRGKPGQALCELLYPQRLRGPIGWLI